MKIKVVTAHDELGTLRLFYKKEHKTGINCVVLITRNETSCIFPLGGIFGGQYTH
jgi:hypothetical protein